jgi:hypothetical protein
MATTEQEHVHDAARRFTSPVRTVQFDAGTGVVDEPPPAPAAAG